MGAEDKFLFFRFGRQPMEELLDYVRVLDELSRRYDIAYYAVRRSEERLSWRKSWLIVEYRKLGLERSTLGFTVPMFILYLRGGHGR